MIWFAWFDAWSFVAPAASPVRYCPNCHARIRNGRCSCDYRVGSDDAA